MSDIVGISGYSQAGKDTVGAMLCELAGYTRLSHADMLKELLALTRYGMPDRQLVELRKEEHREELQALGQGCRALFGEDCWVKAMNLDDYVSKDIPVVITDVRYPNEAENIVANGGVIWRINRPGCEPVNGHISETAMDDWPFDLVLNNDGDRAALFDTVKELVDS